MDFGGVTSLVSQIGFIEAIPALQGHDFPYGLHNSLCTLHLFFVRREKKSAPPQARHSMQVVS
ncbi:hypothetical protein P4S72_23235 [Vibrio sp. PP-XX7]